MGKGGSMAVESIRNNLGFDTPNTLSVSSNPLREQWCLMDQRALPLSTEGSILASVYEQSEFLFNDSMPTSATSSPDHWSDPYHSATFTATPSVFHTSSPQPFRQLGIPSPPLTAEEVECQKPKRCSHKTPARKPLRRNISRDSKANAATERRGSCHSNRPCGTYDRHGGEHSDQQRKGHSQHTKERNRIATSKFRTKKREHTLRVQLEEQELERTNHDLSIYVANLTREVQELKMKLLQHTGCDCSLIHEYLAAEAQRYVCGLSK
uniref:WGS project CBMI000000000 data, contig CS3069_c002106 n=1 Tax=Fusarium clavum TaxID=2594811 RepID=A0A090MCL0_9HYPO|nr:unnamed protein product [Fusarium clavum]CEG05832.1 unnamed protein product [Fusarium clavum]